MAEDRPRNWLHLSSVLMFEDIDPDEDPGQILLAIADRWSAAMLDCLIHTMAGRKPELQDAQSKFHHLTAALVTLGRGLDAEGRFPLGFDPRPFEECHVRAATTRPGDERDVDELIARLNLAQMERERLEAAIEGRPVEHKEPGRPGPKRRNTERNKRIAELRQKHPDWTEGDIVAEVNREADKKGWRKVNVGNARKYWKPDPG